MTDPKHSAFLAEYKALCERHGLCITSSKVDVLEIWDLEGCDPIGMLFDAWEEIGDPWPDIEGVIGVRECAPLSPEEQSAIRKNAEALGELLRLPTHESGAILTEAGFFPFHR